ncbi:MAG: hypothetical protein MI923_15460 [Phycisphaerales bacterium]|nr:hypothetical protein [Phycisphaerales bacterium]
MGKTVISALVVFVSLIIGSSSVADIVWDNGDYATDGTSLSFAWNQSFPSRFSLLGQFTLTESTALDRLTVFGYMWGNVDNRPQLRGAYVRVLADEQGDPGVVLTGDMTTSLQFTEVFTGDFWQPILSGPSHPRPIYRVEIALPDWRLDPGTYWVEFNVDCIDIRPSDGSNQGNYLSTLVTPTPSGARGYQRNLLGNQLFLLCSQAAGCGEVPFILEGGPTGCSGPGDMNGDGACDTADISDFITAVLSGDGDSCADMNGDRQADGHDVSGFVACLVQ